MVRIIRHAKQNPVNKYWYRVLWSCNDKTYYVQTLWSFCGDTRRWCVLCDFEKMKEAVSMFCILTNMGKLTFEAENENYRTQRWAKV